MSEITPQNFKGISPWHSYDYINDIVEQSGMDDHLLICEAPLNCLNDDAIDQIADFLKHQTDIGTKAAILGPVKNNGTLHMVGLMFKLDSSPKELTYCDPSGDSMKTDLLEILKKITESAGMSGQFKVMTKIEAQQTQDQPNTCVAWGAKNAFDFLTTGKIQTPQNCFEATTVIQPYLSKNLS